jgi:hypothetical protein
MPKSGSKAWIERKEKWPTPQFGQGMIAAGSEESALILCAPRARRRRGKPATTAPQHNTVRRTSECHKCVITPPLLSWRAPPWLFTTAACGALRSTPDCRPRRALLHLSTGILRKRTQIGPALGRRVCAAEDSCSAASGVSEALTLWLLRLLPAGAVAGWDLQPPESRAFPRRTPRAAARPSRTSPIRGYERAK